MSSPIDTTNQNLSTNIVLDDSNNENNQDLDDQTNKNNPKQPEGNNQLENNLQMLNTLKQQITNLTNLINAQSNVISQAFHANLSNPPSYNSTIQEEMITTNRRDLELLVKHRKPKVDVQITKFNDQNFSALRYLVAAELIDYIEKPPIEHANFSQSLDEFINTFNNHLNILRFAEYILLDNFKIKFYFKALGNLRSYVKQHCLNEKLSFAATTNYVRDNLDIQRERSNIACGLRINGQQNHDQQNKRKFNN